MNKTQPIPWRGVRAPEKLVLIVLPLVALAVVALPFLDHVMLRRLARLLNARPAVAWLAEGFNAWLVTAGILLLWVLFALWVRRRLRANRQLWSSTGCPQCKERDLVRVTRTTNDRFYGLIGVPAYRYACRNCTWRGLRVAHRDLTPERIAELEASLDRFDPTGTPPLRPTPQPETDNIDDALDAPVPPPDAAAETTDGAPAPPAPDQPDDAGDADSPEALEACEVCM